MARIRIMNHVIVLLIGGGNELKRNSLTEIIKYGIIKVMDYFSETYIKDGKLCKTKKHFYICPKCGLVLVSPANDSYSFGLCWICFLKSQGYYKSAMREVKINWFTWSTKLLKLKLGWSFAENVYWCKLFIAILRNPHLNKTPKISESITVQDYGFSVWQVKTADKYYGV